MRPILITVDGQPGAYLLGASQYHELQQRLAILEGIAAGERAIFENRLVTHAEAKARLAR